MASSSFPDDYENVQQEVEVEMEETQEGFVIVEEVVTPVNHGKRKDVPGTSGEASQPAKISKNQGTTRSQVWKHYTRCKDNRNKCKCHYCLKIFSCAVTSGTSNLQKHLNCCKQFKAWEESNKQPIISKEGKMKTAKVSEEVFREAINEMLVLGELPLAFIESMAFRYFCEKVCLYQPHSRRTATRDIVQLFVSRKVALNKWIADNKQRVSLTTDIWTSHVTAASYMVVTMHFIDQAWQLKKLIIRFKFITYHKGQTICDVLLEVLAEWGIDRLFTITVDNATTNSSALRRFQRLFKQQNNDAFVLDGEFMHMRCAAHIINLIVQDGLVDVTDNVGAIRNAIQYVRSSTNRCASFELKVDSGKMTRGSLPLDIKTRWNSTFLMLTRAMKFKLAFEKMEVEDKLYNDYFLEFLNGKKRIGPPTESDWDAVKDLIKFLKIFYNATMIVSASTSVCSYKAYGEIVTIEKALSTLSHNMESKLKDKATVMLQKFEKYWDGMHNINKLLIVASVFDPRKKMAFAKMCFEKLYGVNSIESKQLYESMMILLTCLFKEYNEAFASRVATPSSSQPVNTSSSQEQLYVDSVEQLDDDLTYERVDFAYKELVNEIGVQDSRNELEIYLKESVENPKVLLGAEWSVLSWWKVNGSKFPVLSEIARDVLAMQVSSVASESAFSTTGRVLEPHRSCLTHYMIEVLICLDQWKKSDINGCDKKVVTNAQLLADVELMDKLEKEFGDGMQFN